MKPTKYNLLAQQCTTLFGQPISGQDTGQDMVPFETTSVLARFSAHSDTLSPAPPTFFLAEDLQNAVHRRYFIGIGQLR